MEFFRTYRDAWVIPQRCCVCGEPNVDGKELGASLTLDRTMGKAGISGGVDVMRTTTMTLKFPTCAACNRAQKAKSRNDNVEGGIAFFLGFVGFLVLVNVIGASLWGCAGLFVVWVAVAAGLNQVLDRRWERSVDADTLRRARLTGLPVEIGKATKNAFAPVLKFKFKNDEYGKEFEALNA